MLDDDRNPVEARSLEEGALAFERGQDRQVAQTLIVVGYSAELLVSTVFLGIDHGFNSDVPVLFETMVFARHTDHRVVDVETSDGRALHRLAVPEGFEEFDQTYQERYRYWDEAKIGHASVVEGILQRLSDLGHKPVKVETSEAPDHVEKQDGSTRHSTGSDQEHEGTAVPRVFLEAD